MSPASRSSHLAVLLVASITATVAGAADDRWYTSKQVSQGEKVYAAQCATCHGTTGEGQPDWQQRDEMGYYPAPPLNADGHAWHHPLADMLKVLDEGGGPTGGTMPSFVDVLKDRDKRAVLAYVQSLWSDETYRQWVEIDAGRAEPPAIMQHDH